MCLKLSGTIVPRILKYDTNVEYDLYYVRENQPPTYYESPAAKRKGDYRNGFRLPICQTHDLQF